MSFRVRDGRESRAALEGIVFLLVLFSIGWVMYQYETMRWVIPLVMFVVVHGLLVVAVLFHLLKGGKR